MPPRFPDESIACLKRTMLARQPHFMFTPSDVQNVMKETGLDKAQVQDWADHLRRRCKIRTHEDTLDFLRSVEKVTCLPVILCIQKYFLNFGILLSFVRVT